MNLDKVFNFIKEKKGYEIPSKYILFKKTINIVKKLNNNIPLSDDEINYADGHFDLSETNITSLGNLTTVEGNLDLRETPISKKYTEQEIRQMVNVKGKIIM